MDILKLPVKFDDSDPEAAEKAENLGLKYAPKIVDGWLYVFLNQIASFNEAGNGTTALELSSGYRWKYK